MEKNIPVFVLLQLLLMTTLSGIADGYLIAGCDNDTDSKLRLRERSTYHEFSCGGVTDKKMFWALTRPDGSEVNIATCVWPRRNCRVEDRELYVADRTKFDTSVLYVSEVLRTSIAGRVRCGGRRKGKRVDGASCEVQVYAPSRIDTTVSGYSAYNWTWSLWANIRKAYASDGEYKCLWNITGEQVSTRYESMTNVTDEDGDFVSGKCIIADYPMPTVEGNYTYSLTVLPTYNASEADYRVRRTFSALSASTTTNITTRTTNNEDDDSYFDHASLAVGVIGGVIGGILASVIALLIKDCIASGKKAEEPVYSQPWSNDSKVYSATSPTENNPGPKDEESAGLPMQEL